MRVMKKTYFQLLFWRYGFNTSHPRLAFNLERNCERFFVLVQWEQNGGRCGVCGDAYHLRSPRPHEAGGEYGKGIISRRYAAGQVINCSLFHYAIFGCSKTFFPLRHRCGNIAGNRCGNWVNSKPLRTLRDVPVSEQQPEIRGHTRVLWSLPSACVRHSLRPVSNPKRSWEARNVLVSSKATAGSYMFAMCYTMDVLHWQHVGIVSQWNGGGWLWKSGNVQELCWYWHLFKHWFWKAPDICGA